MTRKKRILGQLGKIGSRAFVSLSALRQEAGGEVAARLQRAARDLQLVRREEFELMLEMVKKARTQQEEILERLKALEGASGAKAGSKSGAKSARKDSRGAGPKVQTAK